MHITELRLLTDCLKEQRDFYVHTLGIPLLNETETEVTVQAGETRLVFERAEVGKYPFYHFAFNISGNKFVLAKAWLAQHCPLLTVDGMDQVKHRSWNAESIYFYDPAGNVVEFIARYNLVQDRSGPFDARDLLNVSEIGIVVEHVPSTVAFIERSIGEKVWKESSEEFAAIGDDVGLFILAQVGRIWLMTNKPAEVHPVQVRMHGFNVQHRTIDGYPYQINVVA